MQELAARFVPAADEVWRLQHRQGKDCDLFRGIAELGHYAGRVQPTDTRQGIYCCAPSGAFLGAINTRDPRQLETMLVAALERWDALPDEKRWLEDLDPGPAGAEKDGREKYPEHGLALHVIARDVAREGVKDDWRRDAWNLDVAWFSAAELASLIPAERKVGAQCEFDAKAMHRLARLHLIDDVRGQTPAFEPGDVERATLSSTIVAIDGDRIELELRGESRTVARGEWSISGFDDLGKPSAQERSIALSFLGRATLRIGERMHVDRFELVGLGTRQGATQYNQRTDDPGPAGIGYALVLAPADERVPPATFWAYGW